MSVKEAEVDSEAPTASANLTATEITKDTSVNNDNNDHNSEIFTGDGYEVTFAIENQWQGAFNGTITIKNTGSEIIDNWTLKFDSMHEITNIWNATIKESSGLSYIIENSGWNQDIAVSGSVTFGFTANNTMEKVTPPQKYEIVGSKITVKDEECNIIYTVSSSWDSNLVGQIEIINNTDTVVKDWILEFDFPGKIEEIWNATIVSYIDGHYIIKNSSYNANISPGATINLGFIASNAKAEDNISNTVIYQMTTHEDTETSNSYKLWVETDEIRVKVAEEQDIKFCIIDPEGESVTDYAFDVIDNDGIVLSDSRQTNEFALGKVTVYSSEEIETEITISISDGSNKIIKVIFVKELYEPIDTPTISSTWNNGKLLLSWNKVEGASKYKVYKSCDSNQFLCIDTITDTEFIDGELISGFNHSYYIEAISDNGTTSESSIFSMNYVKEMDNVGKLFSSESSINIEVSVPIIFYISPSERLMKNTTIILEVINENNEVVNTLGTLKDDGNVSTGDDIADDGTYSGKFTFKENTTGFLSLRAKVNINSDNLSAIIYSQPLKIKIIDSMSSSQITELNETTASLLEKQSSLKATLGKDEFKYSFEAWLNELEGVTSAVISDQGNAISIELNSGISLVYPVAEKGSNSFDVTDNTTIGVEKEYEAVTNLLKNQNINSIVIEDGDISLEEYKNLYNAEVIVLNVSGNTFKDNPYLCTNQLVTDELLLQYQEDIKEGNIILVVTESGIYFTVTKEYLEKYNSSFMDSIIFLASSYGAYNNKLYKMFSENGVNTLFGFTGEIDSSVAAKIARELMEGLLQDDLTTGQVYDWILYNMELDEFEYMKAKDSGFFMDSMIEKSIYNVFSFMNGSFEKDFQGWKTSGDARIISKLGTLKPTDGAKMCILSTGLGSVNDSDSSIEQKVFISPENATMSVSYNFISEEPMEYVGSIYDDKFNCTIDGDVIISESINTSSWTYIGGIDFDGGDTTTYMSGIITKEYDLSAYIGKVVTLSFRVWDVGDSIYDSAVLIDGISFGANTDSDAFFINDLYLLWPVESRQVITYYEENDGIVTSCMGINILTSIGSIVNASHDGIISNIGSGNYGDYIEITSTINGKSFVTRYSGLTGSGVAIGDKVFAGEKIGTVLLNNHLKLAILHYEVSIEDSPQDPMRYLMPISNKNASFLEYLSSPYTLNSDDIINSNFALK